MLTDGAGVPLALVVTEANHHDVAELKNILKTAIVVTPIGRVTNRCADAGYAGKPILEIVLRSDMPHMSGHVEKKELFLKVILIFMRGDG